MAAKESAIALLEEEFSSLVVRQLELLHPVETSHAGVSVELKQVTQAMYSVFIQAVNKLSDRTLALKRTEANLLVFRKDAEDGGVFKRKFEESLRYHVTQLEAIQLQTTKPVDPVLAKDLYSELRAIHQQLDDNTMWHSKHMHISQQLLDAREELDELKRLYRLGSHRNVSLRKELTGRIQQIQFMRKGLDKEDNPAYKKLLTEMAQNTIEALAQSDAFDKEQAANEAKSEPASSDELQGSSVFPSPNPYRTTTAVIHQRAPLSPSSHIQFEDIPRQSDEDGPVKRIVKLTRSEGAGYGFTLQGGAVEDLDEGEHEPVTIIDMYAGMPAQQCGQLFIGDRILTVNGLSVDLLTHSQIVNICRESKECVVLEVLSKHPLERVPSDVLRIREGDDGPMRMARDLNAEGNRAMLEHKWSEALLLYSRALEIAPKNALFWRNKATAYSELSMLVDARACCQMSLDIEKDGKTFYQLALIALKTSDKKSAVQALREAVRLEPGNQHFARKLAEVESGGQAEGRAEDRTLEYSFHAPRRSGDAASSTPGTEQTSYYSPLAGLQVSVASAQAPDAEEAAFSSFY